MTTSIASLMVRDSELDIGDPFYELELGASRPCWPRLEELGLSRSALEHRRSGVGGSDANVILSGDRQAIIDLWREKRGETPAINLSDKLAVMLGLWTEEFNRQWCERVRDKRITERGAELVCPTYRWRRCTIDGFIPSDGAVWEAKHTNAFAAPEEVLERYMPQLQHNMAVAEADRAVLSVIFGNHRFEVFEIASDWSYQIDLFEAERDFWDCVVTGRTPVVTDPPSPPKPIGVREVCFEGSNSWAAAASDWLACREAAKRHSAAASSLKSMVEEDVARAFGHGIEARRSKAGAITIRELAR